MKQAIDWRSASVLGGLVDFHAGNTDQFVFRASQREISLTLSCVPALLGMHELVIDVYNPQPTNEFLFVRFLGQDGQCMEMNATLFPMVSARVVIQLGWLDGQLHFPPLTPGTLKSHAVGVGIALEKVDRLQLGMAKGYLESRTLEVRAVFLTDEAVPIPSPEGVTVDPLGQWIQKEWPGKIPNVSSLCERLRAEAGKPTPALPGRFGQYGGYADIHCEGTGFFRVEKGNGRWRLIDPDGHAFFSTGVFGVYPGEPGWIRGIDGQFTDLPDAQGPCAPAFCRAGELELYRRKFSGMFPDDTPLFAPAIANLIRAFGPDWYDNWAVMTEKRLRAWGINTLSMFSDPTFIRRSRLPYVIMLQHYPVTSRTLFREFPDVFAPEYDAMCQQFGAQLEAYAEDRLLLGYFLNNEPTWGFVGGLNLAEKLLETGRPTHSLDALIRFLVEKYGDISACNDAWNSSFTDFEALRQPIEQATALSPCAKRDLEAFNDLLLDRYAALPSRYARRAAPNHLNLGMRFAGFNNRALLATSRHFDVFSFNCYQASPVPVLDQLAQSIDKPMLIGEFHFGALDAGLPSPSLFPVASQRARGEAYMRYVQSTALHPNAVGAHYFAYNDQPLWGRYDGENHQFGFVDICHTPYAPFVDRVAETHRTLLDVMEGRMPPLGGTTQRL